MCWLGFDIKTYLVTLEHKKNNETVSMSTKK